MNRRVVMGVAALAAAWACGGGTSTIDVPEGASSPDEAVEVFLQAAQQSQAFRAAGELVAADRSYERMAAVFGTEKGSILRTHRSAEVRDRMIVLAACLRPRSYQKLSQMDPDAERMGVTTVAYQIDRGGPAVTLPFHVVRGPERRWFVNRIDVTEFAC